MTRHECAYCGLAACDLPDGVDPELVFETEDGATLCQGCAGQGRTRRDPDDEPDWCPACGNPAGCDGHCDEDDEPYRPVQDVPAGGLL